MLDKIKRFYELGLYSIKQVENFYKKGIISKAELDEIIGVKANA